MTTAILYIRVSTDEQALKGYSLHVQEERLQRFCVANNIVVLKVVKEDHSARTFDRPAWKNFITEVKRPKTPCPCLILFTKWDRFSRNIADSYYMIRLLEDLRIEPQAIDQPLDLSVPENKILLAVYIATSEVENDRRSLNVRQGIHKARQDGKWTSRVPLGYTYQLAKSGVKLIVPNEPEASMIKNAFRLIASNVYQDIRSVYNELISLGLKCSRSHFWRIIRNPFYSGKVIVPRFEGVESYLVNGNHEAIISEILFKRVQQVLNRKWDKSIIKSHPSDELPLRGFILCPNCKERLTGSKSKGKKSYYYYYHCHHCSTFRVRADKVNQSLENELNELVAGLVYQNIYTGILKYVCKELFDEQAIVQKAALQSTNKLIGRIIKAKELLLKGEIENDDFLLIRADCEKRINGMGLELQRSTLSKEQNNVRLRRKTLHQSLLGTIWNRYNSIKKRELLTMLLQTSPVLQKEFRIGDILNNAARFVFGLKVVNKTAEPNDISPNNLPEQMASCMVDKILKHELCNGNDLSRIEGQEILDFIVKFALLAAEDVN